MLDIPYDIGLVFNVLEHLDVPITNDYIPVIYGSVPAVWPIHNDPVDNGLRIDSVVKLKLYFPTYDIVYFNIIQSTKGSVAVFKIEKD